MNLLLQLVKVKYKNFWICCASVSLTTQSLTSQFLFNSLDNLFCYGQSDFIHFSNLQKKKFDVPDKIFICGSAEILILQEI